MNFSFSVVFGCLFLLCFSSLAGRRAGAYQSAYPVAAKTLYFTQMFNERRLVYQEKEDDGREASPFWANVSTDHSSCGIGFVSMRNASSDAVKMALKGLSGMKDRTGQAFGVGDGAGVIFETQNSQDFWRREFGKVLPVERNLDQREKLSVGQFFFKPELGEDPRSQKRMIEAIMKQQGIYVYGWRKTPMDDDVLPSSVREKRPSVWQLLYSPKIGAIKNIYDQQLFYAQQRIEREVKGAYPVSLNAHTITYKAKATPGQFRGLYPDLNDPDLAVQNIGFHARMGTNTEVTWENTQPGRKLPHNGEFVSDAAQSSAQADMERRLGVTAEGQDCVTVSRGRSDTMHFDGIVQVLMAHQVKSPEALRRRMLPAKDDAWRYSAEVNKFHETVSLTQGPLASGQGPAAVVAVTGKRISMIMDNMGLRTFWVYGNDDVVIGSSEIGAPALPLADLKFVRRLEGGDVAYCEKGVFIPPEVAIERIAQDTKLRMIGEHRLVSLDQAPCGAEMMSRQALIKLWNQVGGEQHVMEVVESMAIDGKEPIEGMGDPRPLAILSTASGGLRVASYFSQMGGVVTNPPIDSLREGEAMDTRITLGRDPKQIDPYNPHNYKAFPQFLAESTLLNPAQFRELSANAEGNPESISIDTTFEGTTGQDMQKRLDEIIEQVVALADTADGPPNIILTDRRCADEERLFVHPVFLASGLHQGLRAKGLRDNVKLIFDTMDVLEAHDHQLLIAQGADAANPYLLWEMAANNSVDLKYKKRNQPDAKKRMENLQKAMEDQLKVVMSKYGVVTNACYKGSCFFEILGIDNEIVRKYFPYNVGRISGLTFDDLVEDQIQRLTERGGFRKVKEDTSRRGKVMSKLNEILLAAEPKTAEDAYGVLVKYIDEERNPIVLRDLLGFVFAGERDGACELELGQVESVASIICRHFRGAHMSDGALGPVAHAAIAVAVNELADELMPLLGDSKEEDKGYSARLDPRPKSGSGEGGEHHSRREGGEFAEACSRSKQIASGRFGVDAWYIVSVGDDGEINIKNGQGAKPYEGGHVKGEKIDARLAAQRGTQPGVDTISPPTHHDIYSIEDLMRLVWDIRAVYPELKTVSDKITTKAGIGTISTGVAKCGADKVILSGRDGGTGAAKSSAIRHTGSPLELGGMEVFASLKKAGMVDQIRLEVDGGIITGGDVVKLAILGGADEFGFGTSLLQAGEGCIFCSNCADGSPEDGCPVGICIQDPEGAARLAFGAKAEKYLKDGDPMQFGEQLAKCKNAIKHYWTLVAQDVRKILAKLGVASLEEVRGRYDLLKRLQKNHRSDRINLDFIWNELMNVEAADFGDMPIAAKNPVNEINQQIIDAAVAHDGGRFKLEFDLPGVAAEGTWDPESTLRTIGGTLAGLIARDKVKVPEGGFNIKFKGYPGQTFGFCLVNGMNLELTGIGRDFIGEAMSGGKIVIRPPSHLQGLESIDLAGASCAYGARGGKLFIAGKAGQRFGVRSCLDTTLVCEGVGKYGFEYVNGGTGVVLGEIGGQFGSGANPKDLFIFNENGNAEQRLHKKSVKAEKLSKSDEVKLKTLLEEYCADTDSPKAKMILQDWEGKKGLFIRIVSVNSAKPRVISSKGLERLKRMGDFPTIPKGG